MSVQSNELPPVTFALLTYNQEKFISEALAGALSQTYSPLEIVISDDYSTDGTFAAIRTIVSKYRGPHSVIINRNETNLGIGPHIDLVARMGKGRWIVAAAGDDVSAPERVSTLIGVAETSKDLTAVCSFWHTIDRDGRRRESVTHGYPGLSRRYDVEFGTKVVDCIEGKHRVLSGCSSMWRRDLFASFAPFPSGLQMEDVPLTFRAMMLGDVVYLPDQLISYREHEASVSQYRNGLTAAEFIENEHRLTKWWYGMSVAYDICRQDLHSSASFKNVPGVDCGTLAKIASKRFTECEILSRWWSFSAHRKLFILTKLLLRDRSRFNGRFLVPRILPLQTFALLKSWRRYLDRGKL